MRTSGKIVSCIFSIYCLGAFSSAQAADDPNSGSSAPQQATTGADNSRLNTRDKNDATLTPQDQSNQKGDRKVLAAVRRAVIRDKALSVSAHNVKIMVAGGVVTLRGPVNTEDEKNEIGKIATQVAGVTSIDNQLDVKTN